MVKSSYVFLAFLAFLFLLVVLIAFATQVDNGSPFDRGDTPSLVTPGSPGVEKPNEQPD